MQCCASGFQHNMVACCCVFELCFCEGLNGVWQSKCRVSVPVSGDHRGDVPAKVRAAKRIMHRAERAGRHTEMHDLLHFANVNEHDMFTPGFHLRLPGVSIGSRTGI